MQSDEQKKAEGPKEAPQGADKKAPVQSYLTEQWAKMQTLWNTQGKKSVDSLTHAVQDAAQKAGAEGKKSMEGISHAMQEAAQKAGTEAKKLPWQQWAGRVLFFIPSFSGRSLPMRALISAVLLVLLVVLPAVKFDQGFQLLVAALRYNPVEHAQALYDQGKRVAALDFITFYQSIPGVAVNTALQEIQGKITIERADWNYRFKEAWKGLKGEESEEAYGKLVDFVSEFTPVGDARALAHEGGKAWRGEDVDKLNGSLALLGLGMTLAEYGPQAAVILPFKPLTLTIKKGAKVMSTSLKKGIAKAFDPLSQFLKKSGTAIEDAKAALGKGNWGAFKDTAKTVGAEAAQHFKAGAAHFTDFIGLAGEKPGAALVVVRYSDDVADLGKNAKLVAGMGDEAGLLLAHGGKKTLLAAEALQKRGSLSGDALKKAMQFGETGLEWLRKTPIDELIFKVRAARATTSGKLWYHIRWLLSLIPLPIVLMLMGGSALVLFKMWLFKPLGFAPTPAA